MGRLACLGIEQAKLNYSMGLGPFRPWTSGADASRTYAPTRGCLLPRVSGIAFGSGQRLFVADSDTQKR
jgi:hypothetical protein